MNEPHRRLKEQVLAKIRGGEISMHPKIYFSLKVAAVAATSFGVLLLSVFILNFILFSVRVSGHEPLLHFGPHGYLLFLSFFPWALLLMDVGALLLLFWMLKRFRFGYRTPALLLLGAAAVVVASFGFAIDRGTYLNDRLFVRAMHHELPAPFGLFYEGARRAPPPGSGFCRCTIEAINGGTLTVTDIRDGTSTRLTVLLPQNDPRATTTDLEVGDTVLIAGKRDGNTIQAFGVREIDADDIIMVHFGGMDGADMMERR